MIEGVSIIVCTHNGKNRLEPTLSSFTKLKSRFPIELILIDNGSSDGVGNWVKEWWEINLVKVPIKVFQEQNPGLMNARIKGIQESSFDFLLFCDDDNELSFDYLEIGINLFLNNPKVGVIGGYGEIPIGYSVPDWFHSYQKSFALGPQALASGVLTEKLSYVYGAGSFFRREPLIRLIEKGFQFQLTGRTQGRLISGDDLELCWLMQLMGYQIYYCDSLRFVHHLGESRISTNYLIQMKSGTSFGSALLFGYKSYFENPTKSSLLYFLQYLKNWSLSGLIYTKNWINFLFQTPEWEGRMAVLILKSRFISFSTKWKKSLLTFNQLKNFSENWNRY
ncbi:glycosyltransferase family 2 protein [Algoriphagus machipongonensis]|uniref:B-glycosyltransferase, glycosyltransferase family 2 protein n=1 Tax=Algoriphagus machipongonensis TaxID=388413 RepID=A3HRI5_9BACT|nr:glycosyltransferase family 2 protein [Algoriphagus machipongonensis]EAZ82453.1 B-glycosyltransferase, glycosyltransferase family 2 protein [Algoriphagus machipongonensis]